MNAASSGTIAPAPHSVCPLCRRRIVQAGPVPDTHGTSIYGFGICRTCHHAFAARRCFAFLVDYAILIFVILRVQVLAVAYTAQGGGWPYPATTATVVLSFLFAFKDSFAGMSPGKWLLGLRAVDRATLRPIGAMQSFKRNLLPALPMVGPLFAAFVGYQVLGSGERLGDRWARSRVISRPHADQPPFNPSPTACPQCGYDLTGNVSGTCPECGHEVPALQRRRLREKA